MGINPFCVELCYNLLQHYFCKQHQHKTNRLTPDSRLTPNADSARPHHRRHHSMVCVAWHQSCHLQNLV
jgi:hypothetical protein